jgi:hypothetical protein
MENGWAGLHRFPLAVHVDVGRARRRPLVHCTSPPLAVRVCDIPGNVCRQVRDEAPRAV